MTELTYGTFSDCSGLTSIILPESIEYLRDNVFNYTGLVSIDISHVKVI